MDIVNEAFAAFIRVSPFAGVMIAGFYFLSKFTEQRRSRVRKLDDVVVHTIRWGIFLAGAGLMTREALKYLYLVFG